MHKNILITGGCGFVGSELVKHLLKKGYFVKVLDLQIYGSNLNDHPNLKLIKGDIRDEKIVDIATKSIDAVIHLACISNDPSFELNPTLGKSINLDSFLPFLNICKKNKIKKFIYASSSSVYGIKNIKNVSEQEELEPITDYSKYKAECEKILFNHKSDMVKTVIRPATVCGLSSRLRLDLVINIITKHAFFDNKIKIFGGDQLRPNIHLMDMIDAYTLLLETDDTLVDKKIYNVGFQNLSLNEIGTTVRDIIGPRLDVETIKTDDNRSYHISSNKIFDELNYKPKRKIEDAINELKNYFEDFSDKKEFEKDKYYNIKRMQNLKLK
jgi:nucleoside-diphosphate-sugar epimerase|tara:strand:- start:1682 stop:2659 length:978 start_codon:yes stop_codon:yes gene_type:complete